MASNQTSSLGYQDPCSGYPIYPMDSYGQTSSGRTLSQAGRFNPAGYTPFPQTQPYPMPDDLHDTLNSPRPAGYTENAPAPPPPGNPHRQSTPRSQSQPQSQSQQQTQSHQRRHRDEFDGPHQLLQPPSPQPRPAQEGDLPHLPTNLDVSEQDEILNAVNDRLSLCAFDFVAKYQFPIPLEQDKREVRIPSDREWTEWVYLLKRLATKRRIPARVLYNGQIKQLVTVLENSLEMRHAAKHSSRPIKDDRNVLQLISAGTQVAKILKDAAAMEFLDRLYVQTERHIYERRRNGFFGAHGRSS